MADSGRRRTIFLAALAAVLGAAVVLLGAAVVRSPRPVLGKFTYHIFIALSVAFAAATMALLADLVLAARRRGRLGRSLAFAVYLLVVVAVGFDGILELFPRLIPPRVLANLPFGGNYLYPRGTGTHEFRPDLGFKPRPHVKVEYFYTNDLARYGQVPPVYDYPSTHILFATDSQGFRNREDATTADIVVLGDSFTELPYLPYGEIWPNLLARRTGLRVRNLAVSGYGPIQEAVVLRRWGLAYRPRTVLLGFYEGNDILDCEEFDRFRRSGLSYPLWLVRRYGGRMGWLHRRPIVAVLRLLALPYEKVAESWRSGSGAASRHRFNPVEFEAGGKRLKIGLLSVNLKLLSADAEKVRAQRGWPLCKRALREMKELCDRAGARFVLIYIPTKERVYLPLVRGRFTPEDLHDFVASYHGEIAATNPEAFEAALFRNLDATGQVVLGFCRSAGIESLDLTPVFRAAAARGEMVYFPYDSHWNALGNRIAAREIERFLERETAGGESGG